jgi:V8-like Glu-specific endopeptidase
MKSAFWTGSFLLLASITSLTVLAPAQGADALTGEEIYKRALKSTAWIVVPQTDGVIMGSGSLIDVKQRLVLTNYHVVMEMKDSMFVSFPMYDNKNKLISERKVYFENLRNNGAIPAKVLAVDKLKDLAVIQLTKLPKGVEAVRLAQDGPGTAAQVHSVGCPGASEALWIYSPGEVRSSYNKKWTAKGGDVILNLEAKIIETTSPTSSGDSGGPLFNKFGEQVGVTQGGDAKASSYSYFIDISEVRGLLKTNKINISTPVSSNDVYGGPTKKDSTDTPPTEEPKTEAKTPAVPKTNPAADEKAADSKLSLVKTLIDQGKKEVAVQRLEDLIKAYPNTQAAKEAKDLLKKLK